MAKKHMKKCSTSPAIRKWKSKPCEDSTSLLLEWLPSET
jgi:hypothetical protein